MQLYSENKKIIKSIINYLQKNYGISHLKITPYDQLYISDLIIDAPANPFDISELHASSVHYIKNTTLLKTSVEMIERLVFISPFVGPIDFVDGNPYVRDTVNILQPISLVSLYFAKSKEFNSKGHACHTDETAAQLLAELEYYEKAILNNLESYMNNVDDICQRLKKSNDAYFPKNKMASNFEFLTLQINAYWFSAAWHVSAPGYILGSAVAETECQALQKALWEGISKQEIAEKNGLNLFTLAENIFSSKISGRYRLNCEFKMPFMVRRYHQALNDLNLFMYQAV